MSEPRVRYQSHDEDSARWNGFPFRPGDVVISSRSKTGTTWLQMICALLVLQSSELPAPLSELSPWLDWIIKPRDEVFALLAAQEHRRFIKTHTPLDGIPLEPGVTYIVAGRHPLDSAVSLYHHSANLDRQRIRQLSGQPEPTVTAAPRPAVRDWLLSWIERQVDPREELDSLPGVMWHLSDAWGRRDQAAPAIGGTDRVDVVLVHYDDLVNDLDAEMRRVASRLGIDVADDVWPDLVDAATFDRMRGRAEQVAPDRRVLVSAGGFFRRGTSGSGRELLTTDELAGYHARAAELAPAELLAWLHREPPAGAGRVSR